MKTFNYSLIVLILFIVCFSDIELFPRGGGGNQNDDSTASQGAPEPVDDDLPEDLDEVMEGFEDANDHAVGLTDRDRLCCDLWVLMNNRQIANLEAALNDDRALQYLDRAFVDSLFNFALYLNNLEALSALLNNQRIQQRIDCQLARSFILRASDYRFYDGVAVLVYHPCIYGLLKSNTGYWAVRASLVVGSLCEKTLNAIQYAWTLVRRVI